MATCKTTTTLSRRSVLSAGAALLAPAVPVMASQVAPDADAKLLRLCRRWQELDAEHEAAVLVLDKFAEKNRPHRPNELSQKWEQAERAYRKAERPYSRKIHRVWDKQSKVTTQIAAIPARSIAGLQAKAEIIGTDILFFASDTQGHHLIRSALEDIKALATKQGCATSPTNAGIA